ncbi:MAG TPA: leucyl aminopeptidase, partial [Bryobacteraceae bacterium]
PNELLKDHLQTAYDSGEIAGKSLEMTLLHRVPGVRAPRVLLVGAGKPEQFRPADLRKIMGAAIRLLKDRKIKDATLSLDPTRSTPEYVAAAVEGAILGDFDPDALKTERSTLMDRFAVNVPAEIDGLDDALERGRIVAEAQNFTREVATEPPNQLTPTVLAARAREMAAQFGLSCEVLEQDRMRQLGMGSLLGVAMGSAEPPALIIVRYTPANPASSTHLGLVGKGVTFDTGGISIKPAEHMDKMKFDMAGGAAVLGAMRAIAQLKPAIAVTGVIPAVENMPGSRAQRPGDIVRSLSGKTIEVLNTDAEGRLILADALTYAKRLGCTHLVDAATLTGAIVVALGHLNSGVFTNDAALLDRWMQAAQAEGDRMWQLPMDDEYKELLKSVNADLQNIGGRPGGSITAAWFLREFAEETPWIHLDIAGTAWLDDAKAWMAKGATGIPVRSFVHLAMNWKD